MSADAETIHTPVLLTEVLDYLQPCSGGFYVDGTLGLGGHSEAILQASGPNGRVIGFEWDDSALSLALKRLRVFGDRLVTIPRNFAELAAGLQERGIEAVDGMLIDIGLSSLQLDSGGRGFSFLKDEPLDMRMDTRRGTTAAKMIAGCSEQELADIFYYYGEEIQARRIASEIINVRKAARIETSKQLAEVVYRAIPRRFHPKKINVATRTFQGLRIAVNTELENLAAVIDEAATFLRPKARFCVICFHSLEDRIVKKKFNENKFLKVITKKPVTASKNEVVNNPRARSAKLRVAERSDDRKR